MKTKLSVFALLFAFGVSAVNVRAEDDEMPLADEPALNEDAAEAPAEKAAEPAPVAKPKVAPAKKAAHTAKKPKKDKKKGKGHK